MNPEEENQRQLDARKLPKQGMDIELAEENFIMILAEHKINDLMQVRQILGRGKRVKGISNGAYFTVEFGRRKTEDLEDQSLNKEAVLSRTRDHLPNCQGKPE